MTYQTQTEEVQLAVEAIRLANEHAFTFAHPAYREAEARLRALDKGEAAITLQMTGGLKPVIGRGIRVDGELS